MKRFFLSFLLFNFGILAIVAQIGIKTGISMSDENFEFNNAPEEIGGLNKFIGVFYEYQFNNNFYIQPEVLYSERYMEMDYKDTLSKYKDQSFTTDYILISMVLGSKKQMFNDQTFIFGFVGPYFGIGINGIFKYYYRVPDNNYYYTEGKIKFGNDKNSDQYKRTDLGLRIGLGCEYHAFQFAVFYDWGLSNLSPDTDKKRYSQVLALSISYRFDLKKHSTTNN
jgi:hypothetical protein